MTTEQHTPLRKHIEPLADYLATVRRLAPNTVSAYRGDLTQLVDYLDAHHYGRLTGATVRDWVDMLAGTLRPASVARKIASVRWLSIYLLGRGLLSIEASEDLIVDRPTAAPPAPKTIDANLLHAALAATADGKTTEGVRDRALVLVLLATGMHASELCDLDEADVDWSNGRVRCASRGRSRWLDLTADALASLLSYHLRPRPQAVGDGEPRPLFLNCRGERLTRQGVWVILGELRRRAGVSGAFTPRLIRHTAAAQRIEQGASLGEVREMLGHANLATTRQLYATAVGG